jgi:hypothetical protein
MADLTLNDCDGNPVSLTSFCDKKAVWIYAGHGWCDASKAIASNAEMVADRFAPLGVQSVFILLETGLFTMPTATDCKAWRDSHNLKDVIVLYDPAQKSKVLWDAGDMDPGINLFVDAKGVVVEKTHSFDSASINDALAH